ncbi:MAG: tetratricopeptide repeat protein [Gemmatimonadaceae bacterium]
MIRRRRASRSPLSLLALTAVVVWDASSVRAQQTVPARSAEGSADRSTDGARLFEAGRFSEARVALSAHAAARPDDPVPPFYLGRIAMLDGDFEAAARLLERASKLDDRNARYHSWLGRALGQQAVRGSKLKAPFVAKRAKLELERAVALDTDDVDARLALVQFYLVAPGMVGGSVNRARAHAAEVATRSPFGGHMASAWIAEDRKDFGAAEQAYRAAMAAYPDSTDAAYGLGLLYGRMGDTEKAFAILEELVAAHPASTKALYAIGRLGAETGQRLERAEAALRAYLDAPRREGNPPLASAHYRLGMVHERKGDRARAREEYGASLRLEKRGEVKEALARVR